MALPSKYIPTPITNHHLPWLYFGQPTPPSPFIWVTTTTSYLVSMPPPLLSPTSLYPTLFSTQESESSFSTQSDTVTLYKRMVPGLRAKAKCQNLTLAVISSRTHLLPRSPSPCAESTRPSLLIVEHTEHTHAQVSSRVRGSLLLPPGLCSKAT